MVNLDKCKKSLHEWENISSPSFWADHGENIDWCPICGAIRKYFVFDNRKISDNHYYKIPKAVIEL